MINLQPFRPWPQFHVRKRPAPAFFPAYNAAMILDTERCYRALQAHDARFDGRFFVGVASTGIYCRPVCRVRTPGIANCRFFPSAAAAESSGFRPCMRCRPELAPGNAAVDAGARLVHAAAGLIEDGLLMDDSVEGLAQRLGVTDRHLRRVFRSELGVSPVQFVQTQRLLLAKRLLTDTALPVTDVALASGFGSVRRFNTLFQTRYRMRPGDLRKTAGTAKQPELLEFSLSYRPPLDWDALLAFLGRRTIAGVEHVQDQTYLRTVRINGTAGWLAVTRDRSRPALRIAVSASLSRVVPAVLSRVKRAFDLGCDPEQIAVALGPLALQRPGLRLPGTFDGFEAAVRAILGQQITVRAAHTIAGRFAAAFGEPIPSPHVALRCVFPSVERVAALAPSDIAELGIVSARAKAIIGIASALHAGRLRLDPSADVDATLRVLRELPGVGEWTAQYLAMRALGWPDAFPHTDFGVLKALRETNPKRALAHAEQWRPWRAYAVIHLWNSLEDLQS
jgi:AraC family transcriptional regulator of adaptative response / DNA-3-methyladenine glycosylase II